MIKAIAFDCGNVLFSNAWNDENTDPSFNVIHERLGISKEKGDEIFLKHWPEISIGKKSEDAFFQDLIDASKEKIPLEELKELYYSCILKKDAFEIVERLREKYPNLPLYTLNDEGKEWMDARIRKFELRKYFKDFITSGYVGYTKKRGRRIFGIFLERTGFGAEECIFVDDRKSITDLARGIGYEVILCENKQQLIRDLANYGFNL